jgi:DNA polymerase-3 subunit chi
VVDGRIICSSAPLKGLYPKHFKNSGRRPSGEPDERILIRDRGRVPKVNAPETDKALGMTEIGFYHLTTSSLERALPRLLEKILEVRKRAVVLCGSEDRLDYLNTSLWTFGKISFIPHGSAKEGFPEDQPVWLTTKDENPNGAQFLILTDGTDAPSLLNYERCLDLFDGNDEDVVLSARHRWKRYKEAGHSLTYWKQTESGSWEKGAS